MNNIPNIELGKYGYQGSIELNAWDDYLTDLDGVYDLDISVDMADNNPSITKEQIAAYNYAINNQNSIRDSIIKILMEKYPDMQSEYGYDEDEAEELMPDVTDADDVKDLIGLSIVHIMDVYKNGMAYTGYEFSCMWDGEHGFGVMMYQNNVIDMGGADISFLSWGSRAGSK